MDQFIRQGHPAGKRGRLAMLRVQALALFLALALAACQPAQDIPTATPWSPTAIPPTATATTAPTPTSVAQTPTPTVVPTATAPPPTRIQGRPALYEPFAPPEHLAYLWWQRRDPLAAFDELEVAFTVHNDVETPPGLGRNGLYVMLAYGWISDIAFYFGVQSDVQAGTPPYEGRGKGAIFSRWETRDLSLARFAEADACARGTPTRRPQQDHAGRRTVDAGPGLGAAHR